MMDYKGYIGKVDFDDEAGIFHGENEGIPAFRFYDKRERRVITCNTPSGVQYIRDRVHTPGATSISDKPLRASSMARSKASVGFPPASIR